ncbi:MAG: TetR/AcrR family transcriptional regulator [Acidiferrobacterales bacterium]|nr:TetR/AcrR family transcriptional regulator [Acidiferrobacterales bacterium]
MAKKSEKRGYHHGNLAESLLNAVDEIATQFGLEAVTLRGCAKLVGVSPSSAFRHYVDKRALLTAFATRALDQLSRSLEEEKQRAVNNGENAFEAVCLAYVRFALQKPAFFRAMWREEAIYSNDQSYVTASGNLGAHLTGGFADTILDADPTNLSSQELLAWSSVHGLANLLIDGPIGNQQSEEQNLALAAEMIATLQPSVADCLNG